MANNDQNASSLNHPRDSSGHPRPAVATDIQEVQENELQRPAESSGLYQLAGPSLTSSPSAPPSYLGQQTSHGGSDGLALPLNPLSDHEDAEVSETTRPHSPIAPNSRRARVEDDEDEDTQRQTNRQRVTSPSAGDATDAEHRYHPDMHTHAQERGQHQTIPPPPPHETRPEGASPFRQMAFTVDWFPVTVNVTSVARAPGNDAGPLQPTSFEFNLPPSAIDATFLPPGATPTQPQQNDARPNPDATPPALQGNRPQPVFFDVMRHLRDTIGGISFGPDGSLGDLPPGVHIHTGPPMLPPFGPMMAGIDFQESEDPTRAMKLLKGLEEVPEGLLKRMERVGEEGNEMPVCAVCFDSLLQPAESSADEIPKDSDSVPMDVDSEPTTESAVSSTPPAETAPAIDTSLDNKVFVLPCAHAFHGSCLRPWFTRPHRTTCPTCRFDIDPESLTYVAPPPDAQMDFIRQMLARAQARARAANTAANTRTATATAGDNPQPGNQSSQPQPPAEPVPPPGAPPNPLRLGNIPIGIILDFSLVFPPGARPAAPPPTQTQTLPQNAQNTQTQPQFNSPPAQSGADVPPGGQNPLGLANQQMIEQIVRGMLGALANVAGPLPPHVVPLAMGPTEQPNSPPSASTRAASEPPMGSVGGTPPPPPLMGAFGGGPLPAFGSIPLGAQGPLPSFDEFVQFVEAMPPHREDAHAQPDTDTGAQQPQPQPQAPHLPSSTQQTSNERGRSPGFSDIMHNIQNIASNAFHRFFAGGPTNGAGAPRQAVPTLQGPNPIHPPTGAGNTQGRPPQPPGPIPLHIPTQQHHTAPRAPPGPKRDWAVPPPPGPTLRERVERKERELGLRCSDISCGLGPTDEDPVPIVDPRSVRQVYIKPLKSASQDHNGADLQDKVCEHLFHPACLVSAERVAGWNGADEKKGPEGDEEEVEVSCPVCRAVGVISREDWDEGACALA